MNICSAGERWMSEVRGGVGALSEIETLWREQWKQQQQQTRTDNGDVVQHHWGITLLTPAKAGTFRTWCNACWIVLKNPCHLQVLGRFFFLRITGKRSIVQKSPILLWSIKHKKCKTNHQKITCMFYLQNACAFFPLASWAPKGWRQGSIKIFIKKQLETVLYCSNRQSVALNSDWILSETFTVDTVTR